MHVDRKIRVAEPDIGELELGYIQEAIESNEISSMGAFVRRFESDFSDFSQVTYSSSCSNGTVALHLALLAADIGPGDEVIVPALTYVSSANAIVHAGGRPVFADIDPKSWCINPPAIEANITSKTKAVIVVHLYGHPADMNPIKELCDKHDLILIEDAAEAHGATYRGQSVGGLGDLATFSFFANKIMTTGEGGMVTSHDRDLIEKINILKNHGNDPFRRYDHSIIGYNYRLTNLQAAMGVAQVERSRDMLNRRKEISDIYKNELKNLPLSFQPVMKWAEAVSWMNCIVLDDGKSARDSLMEKLSLGNIETRPFFIPIPDLRIYDVAGDFENARKLSSCGMNLPSSSKLKDSELEQVISAIKSSF